MTILEPASSANSRLRIFTTLIHNSDTYAFACEPILHMRFFRYAGYVSVIGDTRTITVILNFIDIKYPRLLLKPFYIVGIHVHYGISPEQINAAIQNISLKIIYVTGMSDYQHPRIIGCVISKIKTAVRTCNHPHPWQV